MSVSPLYGSSSVSSSSESEEEQALQLNGIRLSEDEFSRRFHDCDELQTDEFESSKTNHGKTLSLTSCEVGDCITMFGISKNKRVLFGWHSSVTGDSDPEKVKISLINEIEDEGYFEKIGKDSFNIYLVGAKSESSESMALCKAMMDLVKDFFSNCNLKGYFFNPTKEPNYKTITVNFNTKEELHYCLDESGF